MNKNMASLKIASFNVNSVRAREPLLEAWFQHRNNDLDILCLQELKGEESQFPSGFFGRYAYTCYLNAQKRYNGVAICTKIPPETVVTFFDNEVLDMEKRLIYARFETFHLINIYAPHGDVRGTGKFYFKLKWYDALIDWIEKNFNLQNDKVILTGDFNVTFDDFDVYDPELLSDTIGTMPE
jgi:exodeoxyribonuclease-3